MVGGLSVLSLDTLSKQYGEILKREESIVRDAQDLLEKLIPQLDLLYGPEEIRTPEDEALRTHILNQLDLTPSQAKDLEHIYTLRTEQEALPAPNARTPSETAQAEAIEGKLSQLTTGLKSKVGRRKATLNALKAALS